VFLDRCLLVFDGLISYGRPDEKCGERGCLKQIVRNLWQTGLKQARELLQGGPQPIVINGVLTPINGLANR